jgi:hypothetical protein
LPRVCPAVYPLSLSIPVHHPPDGELP